MKKRSKIRIFYVFTQLVYAGKRGIFIFQPISSCDMSRGRFFGMLISNLEEFFGSPPPGGVYRGGGKGGVGREGFLFFNQYHHVRCL